MRSGWRQRRGGPPLLGVRDRFHARQLRRGCGSGCGGGSGGVDVTDAVRAAVLAAAPELTGVEPVPDPEERRPAPAFVPLATLTHRGAP